MHSALLPRFRSRPGAKKLRRLLVWLVLLGAGVGLRAHDPGISTVQGTLLPDSLQLVNGFAPADAELLLDENLRTGGTWSEVDLESARSALEELAPRLWRVRAGEEVLEPRGIRVELAAGDALNFHLEFPPPKTSSLSLEALKLGELPSSHRQFLVITAEGAMIARKLLSARDPVMEVPLGASAGRSTGATAGAAPAGDAPASPAFWGFLGLGVEHIWTGYDHLLFLVALLIVCRTFRSSVVIISCFTLAHSLTLALATLDWVNPPARMVEPLIAASIVYVGIENLWRRGAEPAGRWVVTFVFGLVHGFGFAGILRELGVGRTGEGIAMPLFAFNLGVELGQIAVAAVALPLIWRARRRDTFVRVWIPAASVLVALAGMYWLLDRTVFA